MLQTVDWETVYVVLEVPFARRRLIEGEHSTEPQRRQAVVDWWLRYSPSASWTWLAGRLYVYEKRTALKAVMHYIAKETAGTIIFLLLTDSQSTMPYGFSHHFLLQYLKLQKTVLISVPIDIHVTECQI